MAASATETIEIDASPEAVYDLVSDVWRMGEWSPEATGARGGRRVLRPGARFIGTNRRGRARWFTACTVGRADRGQCFEFDVDFGVLPISTWRYELERVGAGTRVTETWIDRRRGVRGSVIAAFGRLLIPGSRAPHNASGMQTTLRRLKVAAEAESR